MSLAANLKANAPLYPYVTARSFLFTAESFLGPLIELTVHRKRPRTLFDDPEMFAAARRALDQLLKKDVENIRSGLYPIDVLRPENPIKHLLRIPRMFREGLAIAKRRKSHSAEEFSASAKELLEEPSLPDYYKRNFHFQGDGYLSEKSAELYEHQVEVLFAGAADAMRRMIIAPLKAQLRAAGKSIDGEGLRFLELAAGTGRATKFVRLAFPKAKIVALDLSSPYLKKAQQSLKAFPHHDFVEGDASHIPFLDESFDAVYSVFLFHELPMNARRTVLAESARVLKAGGFMGFVDSLQRGDVPAFDAALARFPIDFHEPFYRNYSQHPMEDLFEAAGMSQIEMDTGFFSKVVSSSKASNQVASEEIG